MGFEGETVKVCVESARLLPWEGDHVRFPSMMMVEDVSGMRA